MRIGNDVVIEGTATIENLPISNGSLSAIVQTDGNLFKRELGTISTASKESYIPGLSVAFPSIFNLNTESLDYNNQSLVVSLKNQLQGTALMAPVSMNGTPAFRRMLKSDLTDASVLFSDDPRIANWDTAYSYGPHSGKYLAYNPITTQGFSSSALNLNQPPIGSFEAYVSSGSTNKPINQGGFISQRFFHSAGVNYISQIFNSIDGTNIFFRTSKDTNGGTWNKFWHDGILPDYRNYGIGRNHINMPDITSADIQFGGIFRTIQTGHNGSILSMPFDGSGAAARTNLFRINAGSAFISKTLLRIGDTPEWFKLWDSGSLQDPATKTWVNEQGFVKTDTTYTSGSLDLLNTGTSETNMVWSPKTLTFWGTSTFYNNGFIKGRAVGGSAGTDANTAFADGNGGFITSYGSAAWLANGAFRGYGGLLDFAHNNGHSLQLNYDIGHETLNGGRLAFRTKHRTGYTTWKEFYHTGNLVNPATQDWVEAKSYSTQTLTAGTNIQISANNVISATNTTYSMGSLALLNTGTDTDNRVWPTKVLADYVTNKIAEGADSIWEHTPQGGLQIRDYDSLATRDGAIAISKGGGATKYNAIGIGTSINSDGNDGLVIGPFGVNLGTYGTVVGPYSVNTPMEGVVIGPFLHNNQRGCTVTGRYNHPILANTTNAINDYSPLFIVGNGKSASIRSNAYVMFSDGKGEFSNVQSYKTQHEFADMDIPNVQWIRDNFNGGGSGNGSEDWVSNYGSGISVFSDEKARSELSNSDYGTGSGEILSGQTIIGVTEPTLVYLGNDGVWRKWNDTSNSEQLNVGNTAVLGILLGDNKSILLKGYYEGYISKELDVLVRGIEQNAMFHTFNKGNLLAHNATSGVERVFGYSISDRIAYFNPWMFKR